MARLPFVAHGYGVDFDAWLLAESARSLAETGEYVASRRPGYPVVEVLFAPLVGFGPVATNVATALASALCTVLLMGLLRRSGARAPAALALAFALTPVVWIASVSTMDYLWSLAFALGALTLADRGRGEPAGLCLGLAIGARVSAGLFLLPVLLLLRARGRPVLPCTALATAVAATCFAPVVYHQGLDWFLVHENVHPGLGYALNQAGFGVFGEIGAVAAALAAAIAITRRGVEKDPVSRAGAWCVLLFCALYLVAPYEPDYLIPALAGGLLWIGPRLEVAPAGALAAALALSALVGVNRPAPLLRDRARRMHDLEVVESVTAAIHAQEKPAALLCGSMYPKIRYALHGAEQVGSVALHVLIKNEGKLRDLLSDGVELRYVPGIEDWYERRSGYRVERIASPMTVP